VGRPLEQHHGRGVGDPAVVDHVERLAEGQFDDLDVLALLRRPTAVTGAIGRAVRRGEEVQPGTGG
jgi:hypothetical protein